MAAKAMVALSSTAVMSHTRSGAGVISGPETYRASTRARDVESRGDTRGAHRRSPSCLPMSHCPRCCHGAVQTVANYFFNPWTRADRILQPLVDLRQHPARHRSWSQHRRASIRGVRRDMYVKSLGISGASLDVTCNHLISLQGSQVDRPRYRQRYRQSADIGVSQPIDVRSHRTADVTGDTLAQVAAVPGTLRVTLLLPKHEACRPGRSGNDTDFKSIEGSHEIIDALPIRKSAIAAHEMPYRIWDLQECLVISKETV